LLLRSLVANLRLLAFLITTPMTILSNYPVGGETGSTPVPQILLKLMLLCR